MNLKIIGTGRGLPKKTLSNEELMTFLDTSDEWITTRTGIKNRQVCSTETITDLCVTAAQSALKKAGMGAEDIDLIICSTIEGDYVTPSMACTIATIIGTSCPAFDINGACSGFIYSLDVAESYLATGKAKNILIVCAEEMTRHVDWTDRASCVLFGDAAGACVVTTGSALKYLNITAKGDSNKILYLKAKSGTSPFKEHFDPGAFVMQGPEVFKFAVSTVESEMKKALEKLSMTPEDIDYFVLHQANKRIIDSIRVRLKQDEEKFPLTVHKYGNTSSASIPVLLDEMVEEGKVKKGTRMLMTAFGGGLTSGLCVIEWE